MPHQVKDIDVLRDYLQGVLGRADHHAQAVNEVSLAVAGGIIWRKDDDPIEVMVREGEMKNVLWFRVNGKRYALSYNHEEQKIELRENSTQGKVVGSFSNSTPLSQVRSAFELL